MSKHEDELFKLVYDPNSSKQVSQEGQNLLSLAQVDFKSLI